MQLGIGDIFRKGEGVEISFCVRQLPLLVQGSIRRSLSDRVVGIEFTMQSERGKRQLQELIDELAELSRDEALASALQHR